MGCSIVQLWNSFLMHGVHNKWSCGHSAWPSTRISSKHLAAYATSFLFAAAGCFGCRAAQLPSLCAQGQLNVYGLANLALVQELEIPAAKLATFKTACYNPTIAGLQRRRL